MTTETDNKFAIRDDAGIEAFFKTITTEATELNYTLDDVKQSCANLKNK